MDHIFQIKSYVKFLLRSTNEHGLHSPFLFNLATQCFYDKRHRDGYDVLKKYRNELLTNRRKIKVQDFGAGSRIFKSDLRQISDIAKNAGITENRARLLLRIIDYFQPENVLELGTSLGIATAAITLGKAKTVTSLEGCPETAKIAGDLLVKYNLKADVVVGEFETYLATVKQDRKFDLIYFDGNHQKAATLKYFELLLKTAGNDSVWIFDDIHWSPEMSQAWEIIKSHPEVTVTIDTFQWGLVFFRKEQAREHFTVRV